MSDLRTILAAKRDGETLTQQQISKIVAGISTNQLSDAQTGAFLSSIFINGLSDQERLNLTKAMQNSGTQLTWDVDGPVLDKHSTGGVGDTVSLILAPALAACGVFVPMISGKGLGHTGGTLDKLEAIPGYRIAPSLSEFKAIVGDIGCAIVGQSDDLAPADRRLYALRDETATVNTHDLIVPSILSKKLAAGLDGLVLDVKTGSGSLMADATQSKNLAKALVSTAKAAGCKTRAVLTDMSEPLGSAAGNALEVKSAIALLRGDEVDDRLWDVTVALGAALLENSGLAGDGDGVDAMQNALTCGAAAEKFAQMVHALGGPSDILENFEAHLESAPIVEDVYAPDDGFVDRIDTTALGQSVGQLGGGRQTKQDVIDPSVGLDWLASRGTYVDHDRPIARVHASDEDSAARAIAQVKAAYHFAQGAPDLPDLIQEWID